MIKKFIVFLKIILLSLFYFNTSFASVITFEQILENPTDLELNLNYAKQQEAAGKYKATIATLERLIMLYPANGDIKIYLLSILLKMDSQIRVQLMIERMMKDPNTTDETKEYINKLTSSMYAQKEKSDWFAYVDLSLSQTEHSNIGAKPRSGHRWFKDDKLSYPVDTVLHDKTMSRSGSFTIGKNLNNTSAISLNLGVDITTQRYGSGDESDLGSGSLSYSKYIGKHFLLPYMYYSRPNNRLAMDSNTKGMGFSNTYFVNKKNSISYGGGYSVTSYDRTGTYESANQSNNETYSSNLSHSFNLTPKDNFNSKIFYNNVKSRADYNSNENFGLTLAYSRALPFDVGLLRLESTYKRKYYGTQNPDVNTSIDRNDQSLVAKIQITGRLNKIIPFLKALNKDDSLFYTLKYQKSDVDSTILQNTVETETLNYKITKRLNFSEFF